MTSPGIQETEEKSASTIQQSNESILNNSTEEDLAIQDSQETLVLNRLQTETTAENTALEQVTDANNISTGGVNTAVESDLTENRNALTGIKRKTGIRKNAFDNLVQSREISFRSSQSAFADLSAPNEEVVPLMNYLDLQVESLTLVPSQVVDKLFPILSC